MHLNPGGLIGSIGLGVLSGVIIYLIYKDTDVEPDRVPYKLAIAALIIGAFLGNYLWTLVFGKPPKDQEADKSDETKEADKEKEEAYVDEDNDDFSDL